MKWKLLSIIALFTLLIGCQENDTITETTFLGSWKLTEAYISNGDQVQYWVTIADGDVINFLDAENFTSTVHDDCEGGSFNVDSDFTQLSLTYECDGFVSPNADIEGNVTYVIESIENNEMIITPTSGPVCIEGCSYKYTKVQTF